VDRREGSWYRGGGFLRIDAMLDHGFSCVEKSRGIFSLYAAGKLSNFLLVEERRIDFRF
jgi:hypothetical protein